MITAILRLVAESRSHLVELGILCQDEYQQYSMATEAPARNRSVSKGLYRVIPKDRFGLSEGEFVSMLQNDDRLYTVAFFRLTDAVGEGRLSLNDVPTDIAEFVTSEF